MGSSNSQPPKLTEDEIEFLLENTDFSRVQINEWHAEFIKECPNGHMKREKFQEICMKNYEFNNDIRQYCKFAFRTFDKDHSRTISFTEFILAISALSSGDLSENLRLAFKMCDHDDNGYISKSEMKRIIKALYKLRGVNRHFWFHGEDKPRKRVNEIFEKHDTSMDRKLCEKEFLYACEHDIMIRTLLHSCSV